MHTRLIDRLFLLLELRLLPGLGARLVLIAGLIGGLALGGGGIVHLFAPGGQSLAHDVWWAFLHLTDPGYLGDDNGTVRRVVATGLTIAGLVVFVGLLVAVMTQWLQQRLAAFERGVTRVPFRDHVLVLGWTNRTVPLVSELMASGPRVKALLEERGERGLRVVVLDDEVDPEMNLALREGLGDRFDGRRVLLRYGSPLRHEHLERAALPDAAAVILPAVAAADAAQVSSDAQVIKTLMAAAATIDEPADAPFVVAELFDPGKADLARDAWPGPIEVLAAETFLAQLIAQNVRHTGLSHVYRDLLTHSTGNELYAPRAEEVAGCTFDEIRRRFNEGIVLGWATADVERCTAHLCPAPTERVPGEARLIMLARSLEACRASATARPNAPVDTTQPASANRVDAPHRVLILGWSRKVPSIIAELDRFEGRGCEVEVVSIQPTDHRDRAMRRNRATLDHTVVRQVEAEFTSRPDLVDLEPHTFDDVVIVASDWIDDPAEADARTVLAYLMLRQVLAGHDRQPDVLVELLEEDSEPMLGSARDEVINGPQLISHMLSNVALRRELAPVFGDIFTPGGAEVEFACPGRYGIPLAPARFDPLADAVALHDDVLLGIMRVRDADDEHGGIVLNPPRDEDLVLSRGDRLVVVTLEDA